MFHFDPEDELCPTYLQRTDGRITCNTGSTIYKTNANNNDHKKITPTSA